MKFEYELVYNCGEADHDFSRALEMVEKLVTMLSDFIGDKMQPR